MVVTAADRNRILESLVKPVLTDPDAGDFTLAAGLNGGWGTVGFGQQASYVSSTAGPD